jgi:cytochrome c oxidase subunit II
MWLNFDLFPDAASTLAQRVDHLFLFVMGVTAVFSLLIAGLIIGFFIRFRRRPGNPVGSATHGSIPLEITWSVIPLGIALFIFVWGAQVFFDISRPPANATEYFAVGKQWMWKFQHPEGHREINELHVPVGEPIKLTMTSEDVIHSFYVPAFRVKADVLPGRYTTVWFEATRPGRYHLFCAEYCGAEHSLMGGWVWVMEPNEYQAWLSGAGTGQTLVASGEELFTQRSCNTCHRPDTQVRGPSLVGLFGRKVALKDGRMVVADESYLRESILNPTAKVVSGYEPVMPTFQGQLSEEEVLALLHYVKSLRPAAGDTAAPAPVTRPTRRPPRGAS